MFAVPDLDINYPSILCTDIDTQVCWAGGLADHCCNGKYGTTVFKKFALSMLNRFPSPSFAPSVCWMSTMDWGRIWRILMPGSNRLVSRLASTFHIRDRQLTRCRSSSFANCSTSSPQLSPKSQSLPISFDFPSRSTKESSSSPPFQ